LFRYFIYFDSFTALTTTKLPSLVCADKLEN